MSDAQKEAAMLADEVLGRLAPSSWRRPAGYVVRSVRWRLIRLLELVEQIQREEEAGKIH